jgi:hypothetical protein
MKTNAKNILTVAVVAAFLVALSSCDHKTCPTYSKVEKTSTEHKA